MRVRYSAPKPALVAVPFPPYERLIVDLVGEDRYNLHGNVRRHDALYRDLTGDEFSVRWDYVRVLAAEPLHADQDDRRYAR